MDGIPLGEEGVEDGQIELDETESIGLEEEELQAMQRLEMVTCDVLCILCCL